MRHFGRCLVLFIVLSGWLSNASAQKVYWLEVDDRDNHRIRCANLDGTNIEDIVTGLEGWPLSMALDVADGKMYWTQNDPSWGDTNTTSKIRCANLDGTNIEDIVTGSGNMWSIALDVTMGKMYWTHWTQISKSPNRYRTKIQRANLDGTNIEDIVTGLEAGSWSSQIALDVVSGKIYWVYGPKLRRANLDGTTIEDISTWWNRENKIIDIALDVINRKIYWGREGKIQRANLDGTNIENIVSILGIPGDIALDVANRKIYWREHYWKRGDRFFSIRRSNLDGKNVQNIVTDVSGLMTDIALSVSPLTADVVSMPDRNLAAAVRKALGLKANAPITQQAMRRLTRLEARDSQIKNLTGLEHATQLTVLLLNKNQIRNISPLAGLTRLKRLDVDDNQISNITPLVGLTQLEGLYIGSNQKGQLNNQDVQLLSNLTQLRWLSLFGNQISNIKPLARLTKLEGLWIGNNQIRDVSPLAGLVNLETLQLGRNPIQDTSPLANLTKLRDVDIEISKPAPGSIVKIPDPNLAAAVRKALGLRANAPISKQMMQRLTRLEVRDSQIKNLTGLEHATQLTQLYLYNHQIRDLTPLSELAQLRHLGLDGNQISNIDALSNLTNLEVLWLIYNQISNIDALSNLTNLEILGFDGNQVSNIDSLSNLTNLETLRFSRNQIRDVSPLAGLKKLKTLHLAGNPIQDMALLRTLLNRNPNLELDIHLDAGPKIEGPWVWMIASTERNPGPKAASSGKDWLAAASGGSVTEQQIVTQGATVGNAVGNKVWTLGKIASTGGNNITEMVNAIGLGRGEYIGAYVAYGSISLDSPREQNTTMYVGSDDSVKVWLNGVLVHNNPVDRGAIDYQDKFSVTLKQGRNILVVAVYNGGWAWSGFFGFEKDAVYSLAPTSVTQVVSMPDRNLAAAVRKALGLGANAPITDQAMQKLTGLEARESQIKNLTGLEHATRLEYLELRKNQITDIRPLANLKRLKALILEVNKVRDIRPLANLTQLTLLYIAANPISDFTPLVNLTDLRRLSLWDNDISGNVTLVANMNHLTHLHLWNCNLSDITLLANLTQLEVLHLEHNQIRNVTPLANLAQLEELTLRGNPIQDMSPLRKLLDRNPNLDLDINLDAGPKVVNIPDPNLAAAVRKALGLTPNARITDQQMLKLRELQVREKEIKNLTGLESATNLTDLNLGWNLEIKNYAPLGQLPKLRKLKLWTNNISDLNVLPLMPELEFLDLNWNQISDVSPLAGFTNLKELWLQGNKLANTSTLFQLRNGTFPPDEEVEVIEERDNLNRTYTLLVFRSLDLKVRVNPDAVIFRSANSIQNVQPPSAIDVLKVPTTGTWLFVNKPSNLTPDNFTIGPGEFAVLVHQGEQNATKKANFKTYASYYAHDGNADFPNLAHFFQNGGRIELVSHASLNPLPPDTKEPQFGDIVISEIMWGLNRSSPAKQYIELYNASAHTYTFWDGNLSFRFSKASESPLPDRVFPFPPNPNAHTKVVDRVSNKGWKVPGKSGNIEKNEPLVSMYREIKYTAGTVPDGTLAGSWKASEERVNLPAPSYGTPGARHLPPRPVVLIAASQRPPIYWIDADAGTLHRLIGDEVENLLPGVQNAISLAVANNKIYWTEDADGDTDAVKRANLDGSNVRVLTSLQSIATSIAVDTVNSKLYWTNSRGRIQAMNFNGGAVTNFIQNLKGPNNITLDTAGSKLYWGESDSIWRADLNGRNREEFAPNLGELRSIAIAGSRIYSIERPVDEQHWQLRSSTLDGLTPTQTLATLQSKPLGLAVDTTGGKLYWTNADGKIQRANLNGGNIQNVVTRLSAPGHIVLGIPTSTNPAAPENTALVTHQLPMETRLLANYPNPFNPETWIPYQLATDTDVQILIYDTRGSIVRRLGLGHQLAGIYTDRSQAAYWDGRNTLGEPVASGLYFYQLQTDTVSLLRKMLIVK